MKLASRLRYLYRNGWNVFGTDFVGCPQLTRYARGGVIIEERGLVANAAAMGAILHHELAKLGAHPLVGEVRGTGLIAGVELLADRATKAAFDPQGIVGAEFSRRALGHGLMVRAIGDTVALCPPLIVIEAEILEIVRRFAATLDDVAGWVEKTIAAERPETL